MSALVQFTEVETHRVIDIDPYEVESVVAGRHANTAGGNCDAANITMKSGARFTVYDYDGTNNVSSKINKARRMGDSDRSVAEESNG